MPSEHLPLIVATFAFLLAGLVKGVIGLGLPTVSMGLLSVVMPPAKAASLLIVPSFVTNVWQLAAGPGFGRLARRLWPMLAGVVVGTLAGTGLLTGGHAGQAAVALGFLLMLYAVLGLTSVRFSVSPAAEWWLGPLIGALTGLATAATGVFAIPAVPYLGALNLDKEDMIDARASGIYAMQRFAKTIRQDLEAVRNGVSEPWSNGQTEGQINRLNTLKRAMYGRAGVELLRARMMPL
jgi:uncharacterized protein